LNELASATGRSWPAGLPSSRRQTFFGRLSRIGGDLNFSTGALTFKPRWGLGRTRVIAVDEISEVCAFGERPPRIELSLRSGSKVVFMVFPKRSSVVWSADSTARDDLLSLHKEAMGAP